MRTWGLTNMTFSAALAGTTYKKKDVVELERNFYLMKFTIVERELDKPESSQ